VDLVADDDYQELDGIGHFWAWEPDNDNTSSDSGDNTITF